MKQYTKSIVSFCLAIAVLSLPVRVSAGVIPKDLPTIEALIALHKAVKKDEDKAMQRVATTPIPTWCWQVPSPPQPMPCTGW